MTTRQVTIRFDATDPQLLARFWAIALEQEIAVEGLGEIGLLQTSDVGFPIVFVPTAKPKTGKNRIHLDIVSESPAHQDEMVDHLLAAGARRTDIGKDDGPDHTDIGRDDGPDHIVLADPEGNEFCVVLRGDFLATTGLLGAVVFEPAHPAVGYFWSNTTGWPIVYDEDGDTAIRALDGRGPFITFGPPITEPNAGSRLHLDIAPQPGDDQSEDVERLVALGAHPIGSGQNESPWTTLCDPEGNEFRLLTSR